MAFDFAASQADVATILHAEWYRNMPRPYLKKSPPVELPRPFGKKKPNADVTPAQRAELMAQLEERSAIARL